LNPQQPVEFIKNENQKIQLIYTKENQINNKQKQQTKKITFSFFDYPS